MTSNFEKYIVQAKSLNMIDATIITPHDICFDIRAILKCRWGCDDFFQNSIRCHVRDTTYQERIEMVNKYNHILLLHSHDAHELSKAIINIEMMAFLDGITLLLE
jgi:predicted metal-binding protein